MSEQTAKPLARLLSQNLEGIGTGLDTAIESLIGQRVPFMLICVVDGCFQYIGNSRSPEDFIPSLRQFVERLEAGLPHIPVHEVH
jgi:hypothetical protein